MTTTQVLNELSTEHGYTNLIDPSRQSLVTPLS